MKEIVNRPFTRRWDLATSICNVPSLLYEAREIVFCGGGAEGRLTGKILTASGAVRDDI